MTDVILHGAEGGPVELMWPTPWFMRVVCNGGTGQLPGDAVTADLAENEAKRIEAAKNMPFARALDNAVKAGHKPDLASRYLRALMGGGETTATALDLARRRAYFDQPGQVVYDFDKRPDRWFRDAWRRQGDGVVIDMVAARSLFARNLVQKKARRAADLIKDIEAAILTGQDEAKLQATHDTLIALNLKALGAKIMAAKEPPALKALWPDALIPI